MAESWQCKNMISGLQHFNGYYGGTGRNICVVYSCTGIARNINKFIEEMKGRKNADGATVQTDCNMDDHPNTKAWKRLAAGNWMGG